MANLVTLADYRAFAGVDPTFTLDDAKITAMLPLASAAVLAFTERDFGSPVVIEDRTYTYDGSGFLDIDDATTVASVSVVYPNAPSLVLDPASWTALPPRRDDAAVYYYIQMPDFIGNVAGSPEMGFVRNLDVYARERYSYSISNTVTVSGTWGWAAVPDDVKLAVIWTLQSWVERPGGGDLTSEAIEGWSRSWSRAGGGAAPMAIPDRARDLLASYSKVDV